MIDAEKTINVVRSEEEYAEYQQALLVKYTWAGIVVAWGEGPRRYPAMVWHFVPSAFQFVIGCFYAEDARALLAVVPDEIVSSCCNPLQVNTVGPTQDQHNRHVNAILLSLLQVVTSKLITEEALERKIQGNIGVVDQFAAGQHARIFEHVEQAKLVLQKPAPGC